jgi:hypothetical protein
MGLKEYKQRFMRSARKLYKKADIYGKPLTLTFDGEDTHYTYIGATVTFCIMVFILVYASFQIDVMVNRERTSVNIKTKYEDLTQIYPNISLEDHGFDFAVQLTLFGTPVYDPTYFNFELLRVVSWWGTDANGKVKRYKIDHNLQIGPCEYFAGPQDDVTRLGIYESFHCAKIKNYTIGGTFTAPVYSYLYFRLQK